ncbi:MULTISPECIES: GDCCVxC domain-containing (seleno)protein [Ralstonia]
MPTDLCTWFYVCKKCNATLTPKQGGCSVFCSYDFGEVPTHPDGPSLL